MSRATVCEPTLTLTYRTRAYATTSVIGCGHLDVDGAYRLLSSLSIGLYLCPACYAREHAFRHYGRECVRRHSTGARMQAVRDRSNSVPKGAQ